MAIDSRTTMLGPTTEVSLKLGHIPAHPPLDLQIKSNPERGLAEIEKALIGRFRADLRAMTPEQQAALLTSKVAVVNPVDGLETKLTQARRDGKQLVVKFGIDATGSEVHLGHAVPILVANRLQRMGHEVHLIIGDFTAKIGDPSGKVSSRPPLTDVQVQGNFASYQRQMSPLLDFTKVRVHQNTSWLNSFNLSDFFGLLGNINLSMSLQREDFRSRIDSGSGVTQAELLYSVLMGVDSVKIRADIELGGIDQLLNLHMCRKVMEVYGMSPETVVTSPILPGTSGSEKMSKSLGNYVGLGHAPAEIFGKIMSIPDQTMELYFKNLTELYNDEWDALGATMKDGSLNPMKVKAALGRVITTILHSDAEAQTASDAFSTQFSRRNYDELDNIPQFSVAGTMSVVDFLVSKGAESSKSKARTLIEQGAVFIIADGSTEKTKISDVSTKIGAITNNGPVILRAGKRFVARINC